MTRPQCTAKALCLEVAMYDMFFGKFTLSISRFVKMTTHPKGIAFLILCCVLLFAADPNNVRANLGMLPALFIWIGSVSLYIATLFVMMATFSITQHHFGPYPIYTPVTSGLGLLFVFVCANAAIAFFSGRPPDGNALALFVNLLIAGLIIETLFIRFVMPGIFATDTPAPAAPALIQIGDRQLPVSRISHMTAQEHYISISGDSETMLIRARLGDAVAQTTPEQGLQPHRSWWVSAAAKPRMSKQDGKTVLVLADDTIVPVAKARLSDVQQWIDLYGNWE